MEFQLNKQYAYGTDATFEPVEVLAELGSGNKVYNCVIRRPGREPRTKDFHSVHLVALMARSNKNSNLLFENPNGAEFSACRTYRYALWRVWDDRKPLVMFIGLNPSTANEDEPDPTITRVIGFARSWGYGGVYMMNLFAIVDSNPEILQSHSNPLGDNDGWLEKIAPKCEAVVFAWGAFKEAEQRSKAVIAMFPNALCLKKNKDGSPIHPLYVKADTKPIKYL